jgi:hypothetical protein
MKRRDLIAAAAGALATTALAGSVAWAAIPGEGNVFSACMRKDTGSVRLIDKSLPATNSMSKCKPFTETEVSWNQQGPQGNPGEPGAAGANGRDGEDGISVASAAEPAGANCTNGGSRFTAANGITYACNGAGDGGGISGRQVIQVSATAECLIPESGGCAAWSGATALAVCPAGKVATGGGSEGLSWPEGNGWRAVSNVSLSVTAYVVCFDGT